MDQSKMEYCELQRIMQGLEQIAVIETVDQVNYLWATESGRLIIDHWSITYNDKPYVSAVVRITGNNVYLDPSIPPDNAKDKGYPDGLIIAILAHANQIA